MPIRGTEGPWSCGFPPYEPSPSALINDGSFKYYMKCKFISGRNFLNTTHIRCTNTQMSCPFETTSITEKTVFIFFISLFVVCFYIYTSLLEYNFDGSVDYHPFTTYYSLYV